MFCYNCGTKLSDGARFCHCCSAAVEEENDAPEKSEAVKKPVPASDYSDFATYGKIQEESTADDAYSDGFFSTGNGSVRENEINRNLFFIIAVVFGIWSIIFVIAGFIVGPFSMDIIIIYKNVSSVINTITLSLYLSGAFICVNKIPHLNMLAYMIPFVLNTVSQQIIAFNFGTPAGITELSGAVFFILSISAFAVLTNERITIKLNNPYYPSVLLLLTVIVNLILSVVLSVVMQYTVIDIIYYILPLCAPYIVAFFGFTAVQLIEKRRESY